MKVKRIANIRLAMNQTVSYDENRRVELGRGYRKDAHFIPVFIIKLG